MRRITLKRSEFLELSKLFLEEKKGKFRFEAHGSSMIPFIHNKDILTVQPIGDNQLTSGDIVFYRLPDGRGSVHRIVGIDRKPEERFYKIRGDALPLPNETIQPDQIVGRVIRIERNKKIIDPNHGLHRLLVLIWIRLPYILRRGLIYTLNPKSLSIAFLLRLQRIRLYRNLVKRFFGSKIHCRPASEQDNKLLTRLYGYYYFPDLNGPDKTFQEQISAANQQGLIVVATLKQQIIGAGLVKSYQEGKNGYQDWWIYGMLVRMRYRGAGIGEKLLYQMIDYVKNQQGSRINLFVFESNSIAINLYYKTGFRQSEIPKINKQLAKEVKQGHRKRILMSYFIQEHHAQ